VVDCSRNRFQARFDIEAGFFGNPHHTINNNCFCKIMSFFDDDFDMLVADGSQVRCGGVPYEHFVDMSTTSQGAPFALPTASMSGDQVANFLGTTLVSSARLCAAHVAFSAKQSDATAKSLARCGAARFASLCLCCVV
jgi:hypothetical protein